jgi:hypothetical protein
MAPDRHQIAIGAKPLRGLAKLWREIAVNGHALTKGARRPQTHAMGGDAFNPDRSAVTQQSFAGSSILSDAAGLSWSARS